MNDNEIKLPRVEWPPKNWSLHQQWSTRAVSRAKGGLHFLDECLEHFHKGGTDAAYSRSLYILLSCNVELVLEACLLLGNEHSNKNAKELMSALRCKPNHDFKVLFDRIDKENLKKVGIENIKSETKNNLKRYVIATNNGEIIVEDLECVRYDFKYDWLRTIDDKESARIKKEVNILLEITRIIMDLLPKK